MIAWEVLQRRLEGKLLSVAALDAGEKFGIHESNVQNIWGKHRHSALGLETMRRMLEITDKKARWTDKEKICLKEIYADYTPERWTGLDTSAGDRPSETQDLDEHQWEEKDLPEPESDPVPESNPRGEPRSETRIPRETKRPR
jgi:hypothetical protein